MKSLCMQALLPGYRIAMETYMTAVHDLSNRLLLLIAIALQLPTDFFLQFYDKPMMYLRPLHYSPQVSLPDEVTTLLPPHMPNAQSAICSLSLCHVGATVFLPMYNPDSCSRRSHSLHDVPVYATMKMESATNNKHAADRPTVVSTYLLFPLSCGCLPIPSFPVNVSFSSNNTVPTGTQ